MSFKKHKEKVERAPEPVFSIADFQQVEREIDALRQPELKYKEVEMNWLIQRGVAKRGRNGEIIVVGAENYTRTNNLLSDYYTWKGKKEFAEKKQLEDYSKVAEQMSV